MKYKKQIILFLLLFVIIYIALVSTSGLPAVIIILYPIFAIIGVLGGYVFAPVYLFVYKKFNNNKR